MLSLYEIEELAKELGANIEKYPDKIVAKYNNVTVEGKVVNNNTIETTIKGLAPVPIKGVLKPEESYVKQVIYFGPAPISSVRYRIAEKTFVEKIGCLLTALPLVIIISLLILTEPFIPAWGVLLGIALLIFGPPIAMLYCLS